MDENARYVVGLDVGTENVRAVVATVGRDKLNVVGYAEAQNAGMRKGIVANLAGPAEAIDKMLGEVERMSGYEVNAAYVSINGAHLLSSRVEGMIAMGEVEHEITLEDLQRIEEVATVGRVPANRNVLDLVPLEYKLDGQGGIKDPLGMNGSRLELRASVVSGLAPNCDALSKATENANVRAERLIPAAMAAGRAVLSDRQRENGVAVVDMGATTTGVAIYEEGELQYVGVVPVGSNNVTNDLAIVLEVDTEIAELLKRKFATGAPMEGEKPLVLKVGREEKRFDREQFDTVVKDRLRDIFTLVRKELKVAKYDQRLPEGIVLTGGGARLRDVDMFAKEVLAASVRIGMPSELGGVADAVQKPEYAAAVGLMMLAAEAGEQVPIETKKKAKKSGEGFLKKLLGKF